MKKKLDTMDQMKKREPAKYLEYMETAEMMMMMMEQIEKLQPARYLESVERARMTMMMMGAARCGRLRRRRSSGGVRRGREPEGAAAEAEVVVDDFPAPPSAAPAF